MLKHHLKKTLLIFVIFPIFISTAFSQVPLLEDHFQFEKDLNYNNKITSPAQFLEYELGEHFTIYKDTENYLRQLAKESNRVSIGEYGETYEKRKLIYLVITSEKNQSKVDEIRANNLKLADPKVTDEATANQIMKEQPVVVSYSYNIHGNEASGTEAAMQVAYRLAAANDAETQKILDNTVFVMFPCINPDGRSRYVYWYNGMARDQVGKEPRDIEHYAPWPNGRTNHYWFDLNRDWIWGVHPESRGQVQVYQDWMPQLHVDYHEMGYNTNYFTVPGTTPRNLLLPDRYEPLADTIGRANIAAFNKHKINYFTREAFDFYYPGYGSSYPSVMGAIGMLVEQGGIAGGRAIETNDGQILTLQQRTFDHYLTSIATLSKAADQKELFLKYSYDANDPKHSKSKVKSYIFPDDPNGYLYEVIDIFLKQGIKVQQTNKDVAGTNIKDYRTGKLSKNKSIPKGSFIVSTDQNRHLLINSILSPEMGIEDSVMYDMSTWSAALAYNLEAYYTNTDLKMDTRIISKTPEIPNGVNNVNPDYAYVIEWNQVNAPKALAMLWEKGYRVRSVKKGFGDGTRSWSPGTLVVLLGRNRDKEKEVNQDMQAIAKDAKVKIDGLNTGRMLEGIDLASRFSTPVKQPKVAMLVEPPFNTYTCGQIYFLFDQVTQLPIERVRTSILEQTAIPKFGARYGTADLKDYDVLILPGGSDGNLKKLFGKDQIKQLKDWVSNGGIIVATESASRFFTKEKSGMTNVKLMEVPKDSSKTANYLPYKDRTDYYGKKRIPGSALNAHIDNSHPLAFGVPKDLYTLKFGNDGLAPNPQFETVGYYHENADELLASGYASMDNLKHLAGKSFAGVQNIGKGKIVFLMDNTQYRMFWKGPARMMQNAVMIIK